MRAVAVEHFKEAAVLRDLERPRPGAGEVLIQVLAAGVNPMDRAIADGDFEARMPATFPLILGSDVAGVVSAVGPGTTRFSVGDEVFGQLLLVPLGSAGTYADFVVAPETAPLALLPDGMDAVVGASLPTPGMTALQLLHAVEPVAEKTVLVVGAGGGVGTFLTQLAAARGGNVIAVAHQVDAARLQGYGVSEVLDVSASSLTAAVRGSHLGAVDVLLDLASDPAAFRTLAQVVRPGGSAVSTRYAADVDELATQGVTGGNFTLNATADDLLALAAEVTAGRVGPPPLQEIRLDEAVGLTNGTDQHHQGKTVIRIG